MEEQRIDSARYLRPFDFKDYIGYARFQSVLEPAIYVNKGKIQTLLLTGKAGNGKTTLARLIAREFVCKSTGSENGSCMQQGLDLANCCSKCKDMHNYIKTGSLEDVYRNIFEINCADNNGVDYIRDLSNKILNSVSFAPLGNQVYILDEAHLLTTEAQSALLKLVEELQRDDIILIFCTTDPNKLLNTLRSRMRLTFDVTLSQEMILSAMEKLFVDRNIKISKQSLRLLINKSNGIFRMVLNHVDAICNLEDVKSSGKVEYPTIAKYLGMANGEDILELLDLLINKQLSTYLTKLEDVLEKTDSKVIGEGILEYTRLGMLLMYCGGIFEKGDNITVNDKVMVELFSKLSMYHIQYIMDKMTSILNGNVDIKVGLMSLGIDMHLENKFEFKTNTPLAKGEESFLNDKEQEKEIKLRKKEARGMESHKSQEFYQDDMQVKEYLEKKNEENQVEETYQEEKTFTLEEVLYLKNEVYTVLPK